MKKLIFIGLLAFATSAWAQYTTVSGSVTDPNGQVYAGGRITATLTPSGQVFTASGTPPPNPVQTTLDATGSFSFSLADNTQLSGPNSQWVFNVCAPTSVVPATCFNSTQTISGSSQSLTSALTAAAVAFYTETQSSLNVGTINISNKCVGCGSAVAFPALTGGTNSTAAMVVGTGASLSISGTGQINANFINGIQLSSLATGILKNTTGTGVPSIAVAGTDYGLGTLTGVTAGTAISVTGSSPSPTVNLNAALTSGQPLYGAGLSSAVQSSPGWYYASNPAFAVGISGDFCLLWNNEILAHPGSVLIWDIPGKLKCASNPFNGVSALTGGATLAEVPVSFWTSVPWVRPPKYNLFGIIGSESNTAEDGTLGVSTVACPAVSAVCASVFPIDTNTFSEFSSSTNTNQPAAGTSTQLWWWTIDCAYVQGVRGYANYYGQEQTGVHHVTFKNCNNNGVDMDLGQSTVAGNSDNSNYEGLNLGASGGPTGSTPACTLGSPVIRLAYPNAGAPGPKSIMNVTANLFQCTQLGTPIWPQHNIEVNGASTDWLGKIHAEDTSASDIVFGTLTLLGTVNTSTTTATFVSGDTLATGCGGATSVIVENTVYALSSCTSGGFVTTTSMGTQSLARFSMDTHAGASSQTFPNVETCCVANGTVNTSGTGPSTITFVTGASPTSLWTGFITVNNVNYPITSCTTTTCTTSGNTGTQTGVGFTYGSVYSIDGAANVFSIVLGAFKGLAPHPPPMMMVDGLNKTIQRTNDADLTCYVIDVNGVVTCDDSGINVVAHSGGLTTSTPSGSANLPFKATAQGTANGFSMSTAGVLSAIGSGSMTSGKVNGICYVDGIQNTTLAQAITCAGSSGTIEIPPSAGTLSVVSNAIIPAGVALQVDEGALLSVANTFTLTINGAIIAGAYQLFSYTGTGVVALGYGALPIRAVWFPGADFHAKLQNAYNALPVAQSAGTILLDPNPAGGCWVTTTTASLNTSGKYVDLVVTNPAAPNVPQQGFCDNFTPTIVGSAGTISTISDTSNVVTVVCSATCTTGWTGSSGPTATIVTIRGVGIPDYNGVWQVASVTNGTTFTYNATIGAPGSSSGGTVAQSPYAIELDWTPAAGGGYDPTGGITGYVLDNNGCSTNGGCGNYAVGFLIARTNAGIHVANITNTSVHGFGTGIAKLNSTNGSIGWGTRYCADSLMWNNVGMFIGQANENDTWTCGGTVAVNGTGFQLQGFGAELTFEGGSLDSNTICGVNLDEGSILHTTDLHWENNGNTTTHYTCSQTSVQSLADIKGGIAYDDATTSSTDYWFTAGFISAKGLAIKSQGRTVSSAVFIANGGAGSIDVVNENTTFIPDSALANFPNFNAQSVSSGGRWINTPQLRFPETTAPAGITNSDVCYGDSTAHGVKCSFNNSAFSNVPLNPPLVAGATDLGSAALPFANLWLGTAATNNAKLAVPAYGQATTITFPDPGAAAVSVAYTKNFAIPQTNVTAVTVSNPTAATDTIMMAISLPANYLNVVGQPFRIHGSGVLSTTAASVPQVTITAKLCSVAGCGSGTVTPLAAIQSAVLNTTALTNASWNYDLDMVVAANGASCNLIVKGSPGLVIETGATNGTADSVYADSNTAASSPNQTCTNALFLDFFVQQSTTGASNSYKQMLGIIR